jgi:hypothetical protein
MLDRIKQTTTTTGTGTYALSATAVEGFRTLRAAWEVDNGFGEAQDVVPYLVTMDNDWEAGYGVYNGANPGTLTRAFISSSSNAGAAVNWGVGDKTVIVGPNAWSSGILGARNNYSASVAPGVSDDVTVGYRTGSQWAFGTALYLCLDAAAGAAVWAQVVKPSYRLNNSGGGAHLGIGDVDSTRHRTDLSDTIQLTGAGAREARVSRSGRTHSTGDASTGGGPTVQIGNAGIGFAAAVIRGTVVAHDSSGSGTASAMWSFEAACRTQSGSPFDLEIVGTPTVTLINADAALAAADFNVLIGSGSGHTLLLETVGVGGASLLWSIQFDLNEVYDRV